MKIILLDNIRKLGKIGAQVTVKPGYARNYLIPQSKAVLATMHNMEIFHKQQDLLQSKIFEKKLNAKSCVQVINDVNSITIMAKSSASGKLFGSVGSKIIADKITEMVGFKISKSQIRLPNNDVLKFVGVYNIKVHIYQEMFANLNVVIRNELEHSKNEN